MFGRLFGGPLKDLSPWYIFLTTELKGHEVTAALSVKHVRSNFQILAA